VIHDYCRASGILNGPSLDQLQFDYLRAGFHPEWERDPYRLFAYTTMQERATQYSHVRTGKVASSYEPVIANILYRVAGDEARHFGFYRRVFAELLDRDPSRAMVSASRIMPAIEMPGSSMPNFGLFSDVVRRAGVYGPREYLKIVEEQIEFWRIAARTGLDAAGREAQERILEIPARLERVASIMEQRSKPKTYSFDLVWQRSFSME
jgi:acyl-[acyl-carrier-protein] desaturase